MQGFAIVLGSTAATGVVLASALAWGPHYCEPEFPMVIGCALGSYQGLAGGMIAASTALFAGWLAWSAVQIQIAAEEKRAVADRIEVEEVLKEDVDGFAEAVAAIWKVLEKLDETGAQIDEQKFDAIDYGLEAITKESWLSTSRRMVAVLGWSRRRRFEELFDALEALRRFRDISNFDVKEALNAVRSVSIDFEFVQPECEQYFEGFFRRAGKAWSLGGAVEIMAGLREN